jgi:hypothetical protein
VQRNIYYRRCIYDIDYNYPHKDTTHSFGTDVMEIYANTTHTTNPSDTSPFIPREQWIQLTQEQREAILDKCRMTTSPTGGQIPSNQPMKRVNAHLLEDHVNLDDIIEYTINTHLVHDVRW